MTTSVNTNAKSSSMVKWLPLIVVCLGQIGTSGDNSVLSMATTEFITKLDASMDQVQLANIIYSLIAGAMMVFGGMLGIAKGFKKVFIAGLLLAGIGETIAVLAPTMEIVTWGARVITGLGAALLVPSVLGIVVSVYEGQDRAVGFGGVGAATGIAAVAMPIIAGALLGTESGYKAAFSFMAGWFFIVAFLAWKFIPDIKAAKMRLDLVGTVLASIGLMAFIIGCSKISVWGLIEPMNAPFTVFGISPALPLAAFGLIVLALMSKVEAKIEATHGAALIPQSFLKTRQVRNGLYVTGLIFAIFGAVFFVTISWLQVVAGLTALETGLLCAVMAFPMIIFSLLIPKKFAHVSSRKIVLGSVIVACVSAFVMLSSLSLDGFSMVGMLAGLFGLGTAQGALASQSAMIVSDALNPRDAAQSGGIQCSTRNVWQAAGVAIIGAVMLFSCTALFKADIAESSVSPDLKAYVAEQSVVGFTGNEAITQKLVATGASGADVETAVAVFKDARLTSARYAFWTLIMIVLLHIPGFMAIPDRGWVEKK